MILDNAADEANLTIQALDDQSVVERIEQTLKLVAGFESAYGLELLSSVHWCATHMSDVNSVSEAADCVRSWNPRKGRMFTDEHIQVAWNHLRDEGWLGARGAAPVGVS